MQGKPTLIEKLRLEAEVNATNSGWRQKEDELCWEAASRLATYEAALREIADETNEACNMRAIARKALETK